jgi:hypothetical protein
MHALGTLALVSLGAQNGPIWRSRPLPHMIAVELQIRVFCAPHLNTVRSMPM